MSEFDDIIKNLQLELRKGTLVLAVLSQLKNKHYGYSLVEKLNSYNLNIDQNTLYPLLRRLDNKGLLSSTWDTSESRPRKYYELSELGMEVYTSIKAAYFKNHEVIESMTKEV